MEFGALFAVIVLMIMMLVLCVLIWGTLDMVSLSLSLIEISSQNKQDYLASHIRVFTMHILSYVQSVFQSSQFYSFYEVTDSLPKTHLSLGLQ